MRALTFMILAGLAVAPMAAKLVLPTPAVAQAAAPVWIVDKAASSPRFPRRHVGRRRL